MSEPAADPHSHDPGFLTFSNLLSLSRIPLGVAFVGISEPMWLALLVAFAAISDGLDGLIARLSGTVSHIGLLLDPICDKLFVLLAVSSFLPGAHLDWASFLVIILRDLFTGFTYLLGRIVGKVIPFHPRLPGKIATGLQFLILLALIFLPEYVPLLVVLIGVVSVFAIIDYGTSALKEEQRRALAA